MHSRIVVHSIYALQLLASESAGVINDDDDYHDDADDADDDQMIGGHKGRQGGRIGASLLFPPTRPNKTILMMTMAMLRLVIDIINHHHL